LGNKSKPAASSSQLHVRRVRTLIPLLLFILCFHHMLHIYIGQPETAWIGSTVYVCHLIGVLISVNKINVWYILEYALYWVNVSKPSKFVIVFHTDNLFLSATWLTIM